MIRAAAPADAGQLAIIRNDTWKTAYRGIVSDEYLMNIDYKRSEEKFREFLSKRSSHSFIYVSTDDNEGKLAGFIWFVTEPFVDKEFDGEITSLYILPPYQSLGIGTALVQTAFREISRIYDRPCDVIVWAFKANTSGRRFYEKSGGKLIKEKVKMIGPQEIEEVAYSYHTLN